jgi:hypothetical protein
VIVEERKEIWIGNPRAGTTTLVNLIKGEYWEGFWHDPMNYYCEILGTTIKRYDCYMIVRNPWDRLVSWYYQHKRHDHEFISSYNSFSEWVNSKNFDDWIFHNQGDPRGSTKYYWKKNSPLIQKNFIKNDLGIKVKLLKLENIEDEFKKIYPDKTFGKLNDTKRDKNYRSYYNKETLQIVNEFLKEDIELLDYTY